MSGDKKTEKQTDVRTIKTAMITSVAIKPDKDDNPMGTLSLRFNLNHAGISIDNLMKLAGQQITVELSPVQLSMFSKPKDGKENKSGKKLATADNTNGDATKPLKKSSPKTTGTSIGKDAAAGVSAK